MEFQEAVMRLIVRDSVEPKPSVKDRTDAAIDKTSRWRISFRRSSSRSIVSKQEIPDEFICPISRSLMNDPVIVSSGHTLERVCAKACQSLGFSPILSDGTVPDFSTVIPNRALKSAIFSWCSKFSLDFPKSIDYSSVEKIVRKIRVSNEKMMTSQLSSSSDESVLTTTPLLELGTRTICWPSTTSSENESPDEYDNPEEEELVTKLRSPQTFEVEEGVVSLRKITRITKDGRISLCTFRILSALRFLILSKYTEIQVNSVACLVNLSLEKENKVKIVRSGIVPPLIDVIKGGSYEAQQHACSAIFSLALDDDNKTAIGVLGALPPLLHMLRSENENSRHDSALALYHLSLVHSNITKLIKLGSVPILLNMVKSGHMMSQLLLTVCNLALTIDGRAALLDSGGVNCLVGVLREGGLTQSTVENCVAVLHGLSYGGLRFKGLAEIAGATEVLQIVEETGSERAKLKAMIILEIMKVKIEGEVQEKEKDWEKLLLDD